METEKTNINEEEKPDFLSFQGKNREHIKKKYENKNFKLDSIMAPFIMVLSTLILFFESLFITLIPLLSENQIISKFFTLIFDFYLISEELLIGFPHYISTSINGDNSELLKNKFSEFVSKISTIYTKIGNICYSKNKDKINSILKDIHDNSSK